VAPMLKSPNYPRKGVLNSEHTSAVVREFRSRQHVRPVRAIVGAKTTQRFMKRDVDALRVGPPVSQSRLEDMLSRAPRRLLCVCKLPLTNFGSESMTIVVHVFCRPHVKTNMRFPMLLRSLCTAENGSFELYGSSQSTQCQSHCSHVGVLSSQAQQCTTV
jgi:hypothetical protein